MRFRFIILSLIPILSMTSFQSSVYAQTAAKKPVPTAQSVKSLIVANKNGGAALTQALIEAIKAKPELLDVIVAASEGASPELLASISAAISQAIVEIAQTNPQLATRLKAVVEAKAPDTLKQQVALNLEGATTATATTGSNAGPLGDVGVPLTASTPSSSRSQS